jgi:hypothetical protein
MNPTATPIAQAAVSRGTQGPDGSLLLCCIVPLLLIVLGVVVYLWIRERRKVVDLRHNISILFDTINTLSEKIAVLSSEAREGFRLQWLLSVPYLQYRNEFEVEVKFIAPLLDYLGFAPGQVGLRVPVSVQVGRNTATGTADWVLWSPDHSHPLIIVEAKAPSEPLNGAVQSQARSYAFALGAPMFLLTNGSRLQIYRRGVQFDQLVVDCTVEELVEQWPAVVEALNPKG